MKSFTDYLNSVKKVYEYRLKFANCTCDKAFLEQVAKALDAYDVNYVSSARSLPCNDYAEFPGLGACEVSIVDVGLNYPALPEQVQQFVVHKTKVAPKQLVVVTKAFDEQDQAFEQTGKDVKGARLGKELEDTPPAQDTVGQKRIDSLLKELSAEPAYKPEFAKTEK